MLIVHRIRMGIRLEGLASNAVRISLNRSASQANSCQPTRVTTNRKLSLTSFRNCGMKYSTALTKKMLLIKTNTGVKNRAYLYAELLKVRQTRNQMIQINDFSLPFLMSKYDACRPTHITGAINIVIRIQKDIPKKKGVKARGRMTHSIPKPREIKWSWEFFWEFLEDSRDSRQFCNTRRKNPRSPKGSKSPYRSHQ